MAFKTKDTKVSYQLLFNFIWSQRLIFIPSFFSGIIIACLTLLIPLFIGKYYQILNDSNSSRGAIFDAIFTGVQSIETYLIYFSWLITGRFFFHFIQSYLNVLLSERCSKFLRQHLFEQQIGTSFHEFSRKPVGNYLMRYSGDMSAISQFVIKGILGFTNDIVFVAMTYFIFLQMNVYLTQVIFITLLVFFLLFHFLNKRLKVLTKKYRDKKSQNLGFINERLSSVFTIKILRREKPEIGKYNKRSEDLYKTAIKYGKFKSFIDASMPYSTYILLAIVLFFAFHLKKSHEFIDGGQLIILIMLIIHLTPVFKRILKVNQIWQSGLISFVRYMELTNQNIEDKHIQTNLSPVNDDEKCPLVIKDLVYMNKDGQVIISGFSLEIQQPGIYLLKGASGSGKSLLFKLIMGFDQIKDGHICVGNHIRPLRTEKLNSDKIGYFSNELNFIGKTLFEMVTPNRKEEWKIKVNQAFIDFGLDTLSNKLYSPNFNIKELSENERTLLSFVRLSLINRSILLVDNPFLHTSEVATEHICKYLESQRKQKIILVIDKFDLKTITYDHQFEMSTHE